MVATSPLADTETNMVDIGLIQRRKDTLHVWIRVLIVGFVLWTGGDLNTFIFCARNVSFAFLAHNHRSRYIPASPHFGFLKGHMPIFFPKHLAVGIVETGRSMRRVSKSTATCDFTQL